MEEISRKNEKFMINKNRMQNKEVRGESPSRKASNPSYQKNQTIQSKLVTQQKNQISRNSSSNVMSNYSDSTKKYERSNSISKGSNSSIHTVNTVNIFFIL